MIPRAVEQLVGIGIGVVLIAHIDRSSFRQAGFCKGGNGVGKCCQVVNICVRVSSCLGQRLVECEVLCQRTAILGRNGWCTVAQCSVAQRLVPLIIYHDIDMCWWA